MIYQWGGGVGGVWGVGVWGDGGDGWWGVLYMDVCICSSHRIHRITYSRGNIPTAVVMINWFNQKTESWLSVIKDGNICNSCVMQLALNNPCSQTQCILLMKERNINSLWYGVPGFTSWRGSELFECLCVHRAQKLIELFDVLERNIKIQYNNSSYFDRLLCCTSLCT